MRLDPDSLQWHLWSASIGLFIYTERKELLLFFQVPFVTSNKNLQQEWHRNAKIN